MAEVQLYIYDLSAGLAQHFSTMMLGKQIEGIWHTSVVVFEKEHYFGMEGVSVCEPGSTNLGPPLKVETLGTTYVTDSLFQEYLEGLKENEFAPGTYNLIEHNCNTFSNELCQFLVGKNIPEYILSLPKDVIHCIVTNPVAAALIAAFIYKLVTANRHPSPDDFEALNNDIDDARQKSIILEQRRNKIKEKVDRLEKKKKKKKKHDKSNSECNYFNDIKNTAQFSSGLASEEQTRRPPRMAENAQGDEAYLNGDNTNPAEIAAQIEEQDRKEREEKRRQREPPIVFTNTINVQEEFDKVIELVDGNIPAAEMQFFEELYQYMLKDEGSWAIGDGFLCFIGKLLSDSKFPQELRVRLLNVLAIAALKEDIILVLHQDRREHVFMNYANNFDRLPVEEQTALALFVCNLFENPSSSEWLLYISEWECGSGNISNIRVTTKIAANSLLSENADLQNYGTAIVHNLACKEKLHQGKSLRRLLPAGCISKVFDDVAVELTMAILQFFNNNADEEKIFRCMKALAKFMEVSQQDVSQLIQMIGPQPDKFKGSSERVDSFISTVMAKLR